VANASHELRTPLTAERSLLQVALADPDASVEAWRSTGEELLKLGELQERLIAALLTLARSERGLERREPFDLAVTAEKVVAARREEAERRGINVEATLAATPVAGDPRLVESLIANLVDNALRHNVERGRVEVTTATRAGSALLSVVNTGPLVPPEDVERLFEPFRKTGAARTRSNDGHGLGLSIVRAVADAHGATIDVEPRSDGGLQIVVAFHAWTAVVVERDTTRCMTIAANRIRWYYGLGRPLPNFALATVTEVQILDSPPAMSFGQRSCAHPLFIRIFGAAPKD
jgi:signal transduction histidine kinase